MTARILTPIALGLVGLCIVVETSLELGFKYSTDAAASHHSLSAGLARNPLFWATVGLGAVEIIAWTLTLQHAPLSVAYPAMTLSYATVPLASHVFLKERMPPKQIAGAVLIALGVACISFTNT